MANEVEAGALDALTGFLRRRREHALPPGAPCANCGTTLQGPFCHACGQGSDNHRRSIARLGWEAFKDFFSWDGRFLRTIPNLFFRPGRLARDYLDGRIARHVPAFRLFLIALVVFILSAEHLVDKVRDDFEAQRQQRIVLLSTPEGRAKEAQRIRAEAAAELAGDRADAAADRSADLGKPGADRASIERVYQDELAAAEKEYAQNLKRADDALAGREPDMNFNFNIGGPPARRGQFDAKLDSQWVQRGFEKAVANPDYYFVTLFSWGQRLAILLLPILALTLGLAYLTKRKYFLFDHLVVAMNILSFAFLTNALGFWLPFSVWNWWVGLLMIWTPINLFQTLRGAYGSSVMGAILKSLFIWGVNILAFFALAIGVVVYAFRQMA